MPTERTSRERLRTWVVRYAVPRALWVLRLVLPTRRHVVLMGYPSIEGNIVETARELEGSYAGRIYWIDAPAEEFRREQGLTRSLAVRRSSPLTVLRYLTAEAVFFTHGLYSNPRRVRRKPTVNVWHGSGMKAMGDTLFPNRRVGGAPTDYLVSGATVWGEYYADLSAVSPDHVIYTANPRVDGYQRAATARQLADLGIWRDFVIWMPTFRRAVAVGHNPAVVDAASREDQFERRVAELAARLAGRGLCLVVKPHPVDASSHDLPGVVAVRDADLERAGVSLYQLLGASAGLVTDASSVWTDYLLLDRPIGFLFPDSSTYARSRGFYPPGIEDWLPGVDVDAPQGVERFVNDVFVGGRGTREVRRRCARRIGLVGPHDPHDESSAAALLGRLASSDTRFSAALRD